jgi:hypothetical protein
MQTNTQTGAETSVARLRYIYGQEQNHLRFLETAPFFVGRDRLDEQTRKCQAAAKALYDAGGNLNDQPWEVVSKWFETFPLTESTGKE